MSVRPADNLATPTPPAVTRWPPAPRSFDEGEREAWRRLGRALLPLRTVSASDLLFVEMVAREAARYEALRKDPSAKVTAVNACAKSLASMLHSLGLSPQGRRTTASLKPPKPEGEADPLAEWD